MMETAPPVLTCGDCAKRYLYQDGADTRNGYWMRPRGCVHPVESVLVDGLVPDTFQSRTEVA